MTQLLLEIPQNQDLEFLLTLFKRLDIKVVQRSVNDLPETLKDDDPEMSFILQGLPQKNDFEAYIRDFEESRLDKTLV